MPKFRLKVPKHRRNRKVCAHYNSYKATLSKDFFFRCGYCNDAAYHSIRSYVIDHFVPRTPDGFVHNIPDNRYSNLIYSCAWCNRAKSNHWPTKDHRLHNDGVVGFIIPTKKAYGDLFERDPQGAIIPIRGSSLAKYIYDTLDLALPLHSLNWKFEKFKQQEDTLEAIYNTSKSQLIKDEIDALKILRAEIYDTINSIYNPPKA